MKQHLAVIFAALPCLVGSGVTMAQQHDPTQSWWYRGSGWVEPTRRIIDQGRYVPVPNQYRPHKGAFYGGWDAGKQIERRFHLGDRLYDRLEGRRQGR